jgi:DNA-binding response OmpR family regulator
VVIVEDDIVLTDLISYAVATRGLTSVSYATGPAALQGLLTMRTHRRQPIVLLDIDLPGLDGFSLFERLQLERPGSFRVAFISVRSSEADQLRALRAGAIDFLTKPLSLRILFAKLAIWRGQGVPT